MAKAKAKPEAVEYFSLEEVAAELDIDLSENQNTTIITQGDLHEAFYAAKSPEQAQEAVDLFDKYKAIAGGLKPGQAQKYNDLKRMVKGR